MECYICHEELQGNQKGGLEKHITLVHPQYKCSKVDSSRVQCGFCGRICSNWPHYFEHCVAFHQRRIKLRAALHIGEEQEKKMPSKIKMGAHRRRSIMLSLMSALLLDDARRKAQQREGRDWYDRAKTLRDVSGEDPALELADMILALPEDAEAT